MKYGFAIALVSCLVGGSIHRGYTIVELNPLQFQITTYFNQTFVDPQCTANNTCYDIHLTVTEMWSIYSAIRYVGQIAACFVTPPIADLIGRKNTIVSFTCICAINVGIYVESYSLLLIGRVIEGFGTGVIFLLVPVHLSEIASTANRGKVATSSSLAETIGWWIPPLLSATPLPHKWSSILFINSGLTLPLLLLTCQPEGPKFLLLQKNEEDKAAAAIHYYHGNDCDVEFMMQTYKQEGVSSSNPFYGIIHLFQRKHLRPNLLLTIALAIAMAFEGTVVVATYFTGLVRSAGLTNFGAELCMIGIAVLRTIATVVTVSISDRVSRRKVLVGFLWIVIMLILLVAGIQLSSTIVHYRSNTISLLLVASLMIWAVVLAIPAPLFNVLCIECFPQENRASAGATLILINSTLEMIVTFVFPTIVQQFGFYAPAFFLPFLIIANVYLTYKLPETNNRETISILQRINPDHWVSSNEQQVLYLNDANYETFA